MGINIFQVDAFSNEPFGGNPAGIVPHSEGLTGEMMKIIARELNVVETAFIQKIDTDLFSVRFFIRDKEVDYCAHATIGGFFVMALKHYVDPIDKGIKVIEQVTKSGKSPVYIEYDNREVQRVFIERDKPISYGGIKSIEDIARCLSIDVDDIGIEGLNIKPEIISTGLKDIIVPIKNKEVLDNIKINKDLLLKVSEANDVLGMHIFHIPDIEDNMVFTRNLAPYSDIDEELATGTSNGSLIYLLNREGILNGNEMRIYQKENENRNSEIYCSIREDGKIIVGGVARMAIDGILNIT